MRFFISCFVASMLCIGLAQTADAQFRDRPYRGQDRAVALVNSWYEAYLGRSPDPDGLVTYVEKLRGGVPPIELRAEILYSDEFYRRMGDNPRGFINGLHRVVLGRFATAEEFRYWMRRFQRNGDRADLTLEFLEWAEEAGPH